MLSSSTEVNERLYKKQKKTVKQTVYVKIKQRIKTLENNNHLLPENINTPSNT